MNRQIIFRCLSSTAFCLIAFIKVPAQTDWFFIDLTGGGTVVYIDKKFMQVRGGITRVWQKSVSADDSYTISLMEWNCAEKKFRVAQSVVYENNLIVAQSDKKSSWRYFVPDSIEMLLYSNICPRKQTEKTDDAEAVESETEREISAAQIIVKKAASMSRADAGSRIMRRVAQGEKSVLTGEKPTGVWYRVLDRKTKKLGWLNGNHFKIVESEKQPKKRSGKKIGKRSGE